MEVADFKTEIDHSVIEKQIVISSQEEYAYWGDVMKLCKKKIKEVEDERKEYTKPIDEAKARLMEKEKAITEPIKQYIEKISSTMETWFMEEEKRRDEEQKRLELEAIASAKPEDCDVIVPIVESIKTTRGDLSTTTGIKFNDFEVVNLDDVPREWLMLDESKVRKAINSTVNEIKGLKIIPRVRFNSR